MAAGTLTLGTALGGRSSVARTALSIVVGVALISATAQVSIPLGFTPVPLTGQTFGVLVVGAALGSFAGGLSALLYVVVGALGAPVYADHAHGWQVLHSPTGGYLVGFFVAAVVAGALAERGWDRRFSSSLGALLTGNVIVYCFGVAWLSHELHVSARKGLEFGLYPFVPGDVIKMYLAAMALPIAWRVVRAQSPSRR